MPQNSSTDNQTLSEQSPAVLDRIAKADVSWCLAIYGTAVGAGTLFLPIDVGIGGFWTLLVVVVLSFPMVYFCHRALMRYVLASPKSQSELTAVIAYDFGKTAAFWITLLYLFVIFPILFIYSVGITNTLISFMQNQLAWAVAPRWLIALLLIGLLMMVGYLDELAIIRVMGILVYPFALCLMLVALYLIPFWNTHFIHEAVSVQQAVTSAHFWGSVWLAFPVMMFSFSHTPIISQFTFAQKKLHGRFAEKWAHRVLLVAHGLIVIWVMFFVISTILTLTPQQLLEAKTQNITILSYLANELQQPVLAVLGPLVSFVAISKSFLGHNIGAREGINGLLKAYAQRGGRSLSHRQASRVSAAIIFITTWLVATLNPSILGLIEILAGPITALLLCLIPIYATYRIPRLRQKYGRDLFSNSFVVIVALITISAVFYKLLA